MKKAKRSPSRPRATKSQPATMSDADETFDLDERIRNRFYEVIEHVFPPEDHAAARKWLDDRHFTVYRAVDIGMNAMLEKINKEFGVNLSFDKVVATDG